MATPVQRKYIMRWVDLHRGTLRSVADVALAALKKARTDKAYAARVRAENEIARLARLERIRSQLADFRRSDPRARWKKACDALHFVSYVKHLATLSRKANATAAVRRQRLEREAAERAAAEARGETPVPVRANERRRDVEGASSEIGSSVARSAGPATDDPISLRDAEKARLASSLRATEDARDAVRSRRVANGRDRRRKQKRGRRRRRLRVRAQAWARQRGGVGGAEGDAGHGREGVPRSLVRAQGGGEARSVRAHRPGEAGVPLAPRDARAPGVLSAPGAVPGRRRAVRRRRARGGEDPARRRRAVFRLARRRGGRGSRRGRREIAIARRRRRESRRRLRPLVQGEEEDARRRGRERRQGARREHCVAEKSLRKEPRWTRRRRARWRWSGGAAPATGGASTPTSPPRGGARRSKGVGILRRRGPRRRSGPTRVAAARGPSAREPLPPMRFGVSDASRRRGELLDSSWTTTATYAVWVLRRASFRDGARRRRRA